MKKKINNIPYPLTIVLDRYSGVYSNGKFIAFNCYAYEVPTPIYSDDNACAEFWINKSEKWSKDTNIKIGLGKTLDEAIENLINKIH